MTRALGASMPGVLLALVASGCQAQDCERTRAEAQALRDEAQACSAGQLCLIVDFYELAGPNNCLGAFQCAQAVRDDVDLAALGRRARDLADDYHQCDRCESAGCVDPSTLVAWCNPSSGRCEVKPR